MARKIYIKFSTTVKIASILVLRNQYFLLIYNKDMHYIHKNAKLDL